jgi:hypothetical protein
MELPQVSWEAKGSRAVVGVVCRSLGVDTMRFRCWWSTNGDAVQACGITVQRTGTFTKEAK